MHIDLDPIGVIRSPYLYSAPYQPLESDEDDFRIVLNPELTDGLHKLGRFRYIYVIYFMHQGFADSRMQVSPPWAKGVEVGVFASRSPNRPNRIGLSIVRILRIDANTIWTSGLDALDGTPVLDIKPYIRDLDTKQDADYGWIADIGDYEHLLLHIQGIPHDY